ncbi:MAG: hypothetical protein U0531_03925 [Dehalococcoidia bacterium]
MTTRDDYTVEEWQTLLTAPAAAGLLVTTADMSGLIGLSQEARAVTEAATATGVTIGGALTRALAAAIKEHKNLPVPAGLPNDRMQSRAALIERCRQAADIVAGKAPGESESFRRWLVAIAWRTAEAAKEGGFLGIGGMRVSEGESAAIDDLAAALGIPAGDP